MLNEFYDIANSLKAAGIKTVLLDKRIKGPSKGIKLCLEIAPNGAVADVRLLPLDVVKKSWTIANGNKNSFPFVRFQDTLLVHPYTKEELKKRKQEVFKRGTDLAMAIEFLEQSAQTYEMRSLEFDGWETYRSRIESRLEKLRLIDDELSIVPATHERFLLLAKDLEAFSFSLLEGLLALLKNPTDELVKTVFAVLLEGGEQVCFEAQMEESEFSITDPNLTLPVSESLSVSNSDSMATPNSNSRACAVSNHPDTINETSFPQANLPLLGRTPLFARKEDVECRHRYKRRGVDSISVGNSTIAQMKAALVAICAEENEGKTWSKIPSENPSSRDLLIAYVETAPHLAVADAFVEDDVDKATFAEKAKLIIEAVKGNQLDQTHEPRLRMLVLRKVDPANRKIIHSGAEPVAHFLDACDRWVESFEQLPAIQLSVPRGRGKPPIRQTPICISPASFIVLSKERFKENGKTKDEVPGGRFFDVLQLMMGTPRSREASAKRWLGLILPRRRQLVVGIAGATRRTFDEYKSYDASAALATVSAFHILLNNLGRNGELYMKESAFKLGQLLAAADELHSGYCHDVRNGSLPSRLMGNALMAMAEQNPLKALDVLSRKWLVYQAWAKKSNFRVDEKFVKPAEKPSAKYQAERNRQWSIAHGIAAASKAAPLATDLASKLPSKTNQEFRAELILGYIAGIRSESQN